MPIREPDQDQPNDREVPRLRPEDHEALRVNAENPLRIPVPIIISTSGIVLDGNVRLRNAEQMERDRRRPDEDEA